MKKLLTLFAVLFLFVSFAAVAETAETTETVETTEAVETLDFAALEAGECSVSVTCVSEFGSQSIGCATSTGNCSSGPDWVECDGKRKTCSDLSQFCTAQLFDVPNRCFLFCSSTSGDCVEGSDFIACDGVVETCD